MMLDAHRTQRLLDFIRNHLTFITVAAGAVFAFSVFLLVQYRKDSGAMFLEAMEEMNAGRADAALDILSRIEHSDPEWGGIDDVRYQQGNILLYSKNDFAAALDRWGKILLHNPRSEHDFEIRSRIADIYQRMVGDMGRAVENWKYLVRTYPDRPETDQLRMNIAECCLKTDKLETAVIQLKEILSDVRGPHLRQQIEVKVAMVYQMMKNYSEARSILEAVTGAPHCPECRDMAMPVLADVLEIQEDYVKAREILGKIPDQVLGPEQRAARVETIRRKAAETVVLLPQAQTPPRKLAQEAPASRAKDEPDANQGVKNE